MQPMQQHWDDSGIVTSHLLLVDDEPATLSALQALLADLGQPILLARSGEEALQHLQTQDAAVVLMDLHMPELNGFETARRIRAQERTRHTPIIFLTACPGQNFSMEEAYALGAVDYLVKPIIPEILRAKVTVFIELARQNARIQQQAAELRARENDRRTDELLATLGHELRNPLAPICSSLHVLRVRCQGDAMVDNTLAILERQVDRMVGLVDDLLDVSRITRGMIDLRKEVIDVAALLHRAVDTVRPFIEERRQQVHVRVPEAPLYIEVDAARREQVLTNLLDNAAKYSEPGRPIELTAYQDGSAVVLSVRDWGIGIRAEMLPVIFDVFQQGDRVAGRVSEGLGIGLTLVRRLVEMHGGQVSAHSDGAGCGSTFRICLPPAMPAQAAPAHAAGAASSRAAGQRILVCDDNKDAASTLALLLEMDGHQVEVAHEGRRALELFRTARPDVVVLDIGLPGMSGHEIARTMRQEPGGDQVALIALTGYGQESDRVQSRQSGFDAHLVKPADLNQIRDVLTHVCGERGRNPGAAAFASSSPVP